MERNGWERKAERREEKQRVEKIGSRGLQEYIGIYVKNR